MGSLVGLGLGLVAGFAALLTVGRAAVGFLGERRVRSWAKDAGYTIERCERAGVLQGGMKPTWKVRVAEKSGERREAWVRTGASLSEPLDVLWAAPGESVFR